ncbi:MAG: O-antigen ligase family protein [Armatimonadetes bacterium]|nr:O-antigen ligase family protein [Armatimonadota bacterium]MBX3107597.1 O-antigen ligase family protein [Fimbriimonadaceae bacterium]
MTKDSKSKPGMDFWLLVFAAALAPLVGGHVALEARPIDLGMFGELFGGGALPYLARLIVGAPILCGLFLMAMRDRVIQLPNIRIIGTLTAFVFLLGFAILFGSFHYVSFGEWLTWFVYGGALFLTIGTVGRGRGAVIVAAAVGVSAAWVALLGVREYLEVMASEPTHRIFAGWNNPNAVASLFVCGALVNIGLGGRTPGIAKLLPVIGASACLAALVLTQSKGGYLAFGLGFAVYCGVLLASGKDKRPLGVGIAALALGLAIGLGATASAPKTPAGGALVRIGSGASAEQSVGFRQNLWKSAVSIAAKHPTGTGPGTFRFYSAEPGIIESTVFAHQSYLQLAVEGGWLALILYLATAVFWVSYAFRGIRKQPGETVAFRAGLLGAAIGLAGHGFVESNLSFMGSGLLLFILVGLTLQLSTDGTSPESVPRQLRFAIATLTCALPLVGLAVFAASEANKSVLATAVFRDLNPAKAVEAAGVIKANSFGDPEAIYLAGFYGSSSPKERAELVTQAAEAMPQPRLLRSAARVLAEEGKVDEAIAMNNKVFRIDPNNLNAHWLKIQFLQRKGDTSAVDEACRDLIKVESQTSFKVRAIPEIVPTETYDARLILAGDSEDRKEKIRLLEEALTGYARFMSVTAPLVKRLTNDQNPEYGGVSRQDVEETQKRAKEALATLKGLYGPSSSGINLTEISGALDFSF